MTIEKVVEDGVTIYESTGADSGGIAVDYTEVFDSIDLRLEEHNLKLDEQNQILTDLVTEAKTANETFSGILQQLTRLANCTCTPCSGVDLCELLEKAVNGG